MPCALAAWLPVADWGRRYDAATARADGVAALIVTLMLVPQSLAYAQLAGLPPATGLYASIGPLLVYALLGSSSTLAVGPAAVTSLMTAAALGSVVPAGSPAYAAAALTLAALSGAVLLAMGLLRLGAVAHFLSHPVATGFASASGLLIAAGQLRHLLGLPVPGTTLPEIGAALWTAFQDGAAVHRPTLALGGGALAALWWARRRLKPLLLQRSWPAARADLLVRAMPVFVLTASALAVWACGLDARGVKVVGDIPAGLPPLSWPVWDAALLRELLAPALLIGVVGFAESVSVGQTLAARRRERIEPDQELRALGLSNLAAAFTSGLPVTGGFSRSVVNDDAGARTPAAGAWTALGLALATTTLTPMLRLLPQAALAATIVVAVLSLVDLGALRRTWRFSRRDFAALAATLLVTLAVGVEAGLIAGVALSLLLQLARSARPHIAVIGWVPGTEHFRNVRRHEVKSSPRLLGLRIDESLWFANARQLEDRLGAAPAEQPALQHVVLQCSAVNDIDASALESLQAIAHRLREAGVSLHLSEVKGPVMDRLRHSTLLQEIGQPVFLTHYQAVQALAPEVFVDADGPPSDRAERPALSGGCVQPA